MMSANGLLGLIGDIYEASLREDGWRDVLRSVSDHMDAVDIGGAVIDIDMSSKKPLRVVAEGFSNNVADDYLQRRRYPLLCGLFISKD